MSLRRGCEHLRFSCSPLPPFLASLVQTQEIWLGLEEYGKSSGQPTGSGEQEICVGPMQTKAETVALVVRFWALR